MNADTLNQPYLVAVGKALADLDEWRHAGEDREFSLMTDPNDNNLVECNLMEGTRHVWTKEGKIINGKRLSTAYDVVAAALDEWQRAT